MMLHVSLKVCKEHWCLLFTGNLLQKVVGVCSTQELDQLELDKLLPINLFPDVWKKAQPVTKITDAVYPFNTKKTRPIENEVRHYTHVHNNARHVGKLIRIFWQVNSPHKYIIHYTGSLCWQTYKFMCSLLSVIKYNTISIYLDSLQVHLKN